MSKEHTCISLDPGLSFECHKLGIQISPTCNEFLSNLIAIKKKDPSNATLLEVESRLEVKRMEYAKAYSELQKDELLWQELKKKEAENKEANAQKEKKRIMSQKTCLNCGKVLTDVEKRIKFNKGVVCNSCYYTAKGDQIKKWMGDA